ncbi:MAG: carbon-nitrogen hydrolase family protein, partial [Pseudomonadota bacterium]
SLNRAGADYGGSIYCPPWMDEENPPVHFPDKDVAFCEIPINRQEIADARAAYSFLADRLPTYDLPLIPTEPTD